MQATPITGHSNHRAALLAMIDRAHSLVAQWDQGLSMEEREAAGSFQRWSARETLVHIGHWHQQTAHTLAFDRSIG